MAEIRVDVRRQSTPLVDPPGLTDSQGKSLGNISAFAFRFNVMRDLEATGGVEKEPIFLFTVIPTVLVAADSTIRITLGLAQTSFEPATYRAELIWRTDGTDPVFPVAPDDFNIATFTITDEAEVIP